jgi:hypothetical protein
MDLFFIHIQYHNAETTRKIGIWTDEINIVNGFIPQNGGPLDIRNVNDFIVLDKIDIGIGISDHQGVIRCIIVDGGDPDIRKAVDLVDPLNAVILFIVIKKGIYRGTVDPASDFFHGNTLGIWKMVPPLANARCLCKACDRYPKKEQGDKGIPHRYHEIKIKKYSYEYCQCKTCMLIIGIPCGRQAWDH